MSRPWMPLYVADYLADTGHLSTIEHGAYLLLIMHYWAKGGLPDDDKRLASIARASLEQWADMRGTIAEFFGAGWKHERIDQELVSAEKAYERRASAGRAGGKAKAEAKQRSSNATALPQQSQSQPHKKEDAIASKARARAPDHEFEDWYSRYPHKVQRGAAEKAFVAARKIASLDELINGLHRYIASKPEDRQWQNPATWLNGKGWLDEPAGPAIRNARWPVGPTPRQSGVSAAAQRIMESENNGSDSIFGDHGDAQRLPPAGGGRPRNAASDLPGGIGRQFLTIDH